MVTLAAVAVKWVILAIGTVAAAPVPGERAADEERLRAAY